MILQSSQTSTTVQVHEQDSGKVRLRTSAWYQLHVEATRRNLILPDLPGHLANAVPGTEVLEYYKLRVLYIYLMYIYIYDTHQS
jgi:hypothetical protein